MDREVTKVGRYVSDFFKVLKKAGTSVTSTRSLTDR